MMAWRLHFRPAVECTRLCLTPGVPPGSWLPVRMRRVAMNETFRQVGEILIQIVSNLTNPDAWRQVLERPEVFWAAFIAVSVIVFTETGLLFGFFLPGDSLLVTVGIVAHAAGWPIHI